MKKKSKAEKLANKYGYTIIAKPMTWQEVFRQITECRWVGCKKWREVGSFCKKHYKEHRDRIDCHNEN